MRKQFVSVGCDSAALVTSCTAVAFWGNCFPAKRHKGGRKSDKSLMRRKDSLHACVNQTGKEQSERVDEEDDGKGHKQEVLKMVPERGSATTCDAQGCSCVTSCLFGCCEMPHCCFTNTNIFYCRSVRQLQEHRLGFLPIVATRKQEKQVMRLYIQNNEEEQV